MDLVCRLCSQEVSSFESIFTFKNGRLISDLIQNLIPLKIEINDCYPKKICLNCLEIILKMTNLRETSIKSDISFRDGSFQVQQPQQITDEESDDECTLSDLVAKSAKRPRLSEAFDDSKKLLSSEKLSVIDQKIDKILESLKKLDRKRSEIELMYRKQDNKLNPYSTLTCLQTSIGPKPKTFPSDLKAKNTDELNEIDNLLENPENCEYFRKYLLNVTANIPDFKTFMKQSLEVIMTSDLKASLSFANNIRNLKAYAMIVDLCTKKFHVSTEQIDSFIRKNITNLKHYKKLEKRNKFEVQPESFASNASSSSLISGDDDLPDIKTEVYFEVEHIN